MYRFQMNQNHSFGICVSVRALTTWIGGGLSLYKTQERGGLKRKKELVTTCLAFLPPFKPSI